MTPQEPCNDCGKTHPYFECNPGNQMDNKTQERIKADAEELSQEKGTAYAYGYIAGATAEHDKTQSAIDILEEAYNSHVEEKRLLVERYPHLFPNIDNYVKPWVGKAKAFLEQWRGKEVERPCPHCGKELSRDCNLCCRECGKEVKEKEQLLNTCGICKKRPMGNGITVCDECYQNFDGDRRGFWDSETYQ